MTTIADVISSQQAIGNAATTAFLAGQQIQRRAAPQSADAAADDQRRLVDQAHRSPGKPLEPDLCAEANARLGSDYSRVRLHTDVAAQRSAAALGALAYTSKNEVFVGAGGIDKKTLLHELAHTDQQSQGAVEGTDNGNGVKVSSPNDRHERAADAAAEAGMRVSLQRSPAGEATVPVQSAPVPATTAGPPAAGGTAEPVAVQRVTADALQEGFVVGEQPLADDMERQAFKNLLSASLLNVLSAAEEQKDEGKPRQRTPAARRAEARRQMAQLSADAAISALAQAGVTYAGIMSDLEPEVAKLHAEAEQQRQERGAVMDEADETLFGQRTERPTTKKINIDVPGLGTGSVLVVKAKNPDYPRMLAWFSHGYEGKAYIDVEQARRYAFAIEPEKTLVRIATEDVYASIPGAMQASPAKPTTRAPDLTGIPHSAAELAGEIDTLANVANYCDMAIWLDFTWASQVEEQYNELKKAGTAPIPTIIDRTPGLMEYDSMLLFTCRTPWAPDAPVKGSKGRHAEAVEQIRAERAAAAEAGGASVGKAPEDQDSLVAEADKRIFANPEANTVYPYPGNTAFRPAASSSTTTPAPAGAALPAPVTATRTRQTSWWRSAWESFLRIFRRLFRRRQAGS